MQTAGLNEALLLEEQELLPASMGVGRYKNEIEKIIGIIEKNKKHRRFNMTPMPFASKF